MNNEERRFDLMFTFVWSVVEAIETHRINAFCAASPFLGRLRRKLMEPRKGVDGWIHNHFDPGEAFTLALIAKNEFVCTPNLQKLISIWEERGLRELDWPLSIDWEGNAIYETERFAFAAVAAPAGDEALETCYVGERGKRMEAELRLTHLKSVDNPTFGKFYVHRFMDDKNRVFVWKTGKNDLRVGEWVRAKFTVDKHAEDKYNSGMLTTFIKRLVFQKEEKKR